MSACYYAGLDYEVGGDLPRAKEYYEKACKGGEGFGCYFLGSLYLRGAGVTKDVRRAAALFKQTCDTNNASGCVVYGGLQSNPDTQIDQNLTSARAYYEKACSLDPYKCDRLASLYYKGLGVERDFNKSKTLYGKACEKGNQGACTKFRTSDEYHFALSYIKGDGVARDIPKGLKLLNAVCHSDDVFAVEACMSAGGLYSDPKNLIDQNLSVATSYYERACELNPAKCDNAAVLYARGLGVKRDFERAKKLYAKACEAGNAKACSAYNDDDEYKFALSYVSGNGVKQDLDVGMKLLGAVCESDNINAANACVSAGDLYTDRKGQVGLDYAAAKTRYERACEIDPSKCDKIALLYAKGLGAAKDLRTAKTLYAKACENGNIEACNGYRDVALYSNLNIKNATCDDTPKLAAACRFEVIEACNRLGSMYSDGICRQNLDMARAWYGKSCDLLDEKGCKEFKRINEFLLQLEVGANKKSEEKK